MNKSLFFLASQALACLGLFAPPASGQCATAQFALAPISSTGLPANQSVAVGDSPNEVAIGFFNGDTTPDFATAESIGRTVSVRLGQGDGTFRPAPTSLISFPATPRSIVAGDFNEDGRDDLVVATLEGVVYYLEGRGDGTFESLDSVASGLGTTNNTRMIVTRFYGDDHLDVAISMEERDAVEILLGDGDGDFTRASNLRINDPIGLVAGRFSGVDTVPDLAVVSREDRTVTIFEGEPLPGSFDEGDTITVSTSPDILSSGITAGDFNGNGTQELAVLNRRIGTTGPDETLVILYGANNGSFIAGPVLDPGGGPHQLEAADLNRDGILDLAVASSFPRQASVLLGMGTGDFQPRAAFSAGGNPLDIAIADLDGSGAPDLVVVNQPSDTVTVYLNTCNCLPSNLTPTATGSSTTMQQGSVPVRVDVASGTDPDGPDGGLTARLLTSTTISVTDLANDNGTLSALVAPACNTPVGTHNLEIEVSDGCRTTTAILQVDVTANTPPIAPDDTSATVPFGSTSTGTLTPLASDNGPFSAAFTVTPNTFTGTGTYDPLTGDVLIADAAPVGSYSGDLTLTDSCGSTTTATYGLTVVPATSVTTATSDVPDPSRVGQSFDVSWSVDVVVPGVATPTGTVTVSGGGSTCSAPVATGTCSMSLADVGNTTLTVSYSGDGNVAPSSTTEAHQVAPGDTTTTFVSTSPDPSVVGQPVQVTWTVDVVAPAVGTPTGTVTVSDGVQSCSAPVADGSCSLTFATAGPRTLTASYAGDARFSASQDNGSLTVDPASTQTQILASTPNPSLFGAPVSVGWSVGATPPGAGTPTGQVTVSDGVSTCTAPISAGSCVLSLQTVGPRTLTAGYSGDADFAASQTSAAHEVLPGETQLTILADTPDPSPTGAAVTVTWSLAAVAPAVGTPTGTVTVSDGVDSCSAPAGAGSCMLTLGTMGLRTLVASYPGDGNFAASQAEELHVVGIPDLQVGKTGILAEDMNGDGVANPGDRITYTVEIENVGSGDAEDVRLIDIVDPNAVLVCGAPAPPTTSTGSIEACQATAEGSLVVSLGRVTVGGAPITVTYQIVVGDLPPEQETFLRNQAILQAAGLADVLSDDPSTAGPDDPTVFPVRGAAAIAEIPTLSSWSLLGLALLLAGLGLKAMRP